MGQNNKETIEIQDDNAPQTEIRFLDQLSQEILGPNASKIICCLSSAYLKVITPQKQTTQHEI